MPNMGINHGPQKLVGVLLDTPFTIQKGAQSRNITLPWPMAPLGFKDDMAIIHHDDSLVRMTGVDKQVVDTPWSEIQSLTVSMSAFGNICSFALK